MPAALLLALVLVWSALGLITWVMGDKIVH